MQMPNAPDEYVEARDPVDQPPPPCPTCGTPVDTDWIEVTTPTDPQPVYMPGRIRCPTNERHDVRAAYAELSWPASLTDDDRAWLRQQRSLGEHIHVGRDGHGEMHGTAARRLMVSNPWPSLDLQTYWPDAESRIPVTKEQ